MKLIKSLKGLVLSTIFAFGTIASAATNDSYALQEQFDTLFEATIKLLKDNKDLQKRVNELEDKLSYIEDLESKIKRFNTLSEKLVNIEVLENQVRDTAQTLHERMLQLRAASDLITSKNDELSKLASILVNENAEIRSHTISTENRVLANEANIAAIKKEQIRDKVALGLKKKNKELSQDEKLAQIRSEIVNLGSSSVIITTRVNVRKEANKNSKKIGSLQKDKIVMVKSIKNNWLELQDGGYIFSKYAKPLEKPKSEIDFDESVLEQINNLINGARNIEPKKIGSTKAQKFFNNEARALKKSPVITKIVNDSEFLALPEASYDEKGNLIIPPNYDFKSDLCDTDCLRIGIGGAICKCREK